MIEVLCEITLKMIYLRFLNRYFSELLAHNLFNDCVPFNQCKRVILVVNCVKFIKLFRLLKYDITFYYLDHYLSKLSDALTNESSTLPHFVLAYRIFKTFSKLSKGCFIHTLSCLRTLRNQLAPIDPSKVVFCTLMECLLLQVFSETFTKIDSFEFKDLTAEMADSQVYVDLFETGEIAVLNRSFGDNHFEFEPDSAAILRIYKTTRFFTTEECGKLLVNFIPSPYDLRGTGARLLFNFPLIFYFREIFKT